MIRPLDTTISFLARHRPHNPSRWVVPYLLVVLTILLGLSLWQWHETSTFARDLRDGLVKSCEENGNPLREAVQDQIRHQIEQRETVDYTRFFPTIPPGELERLLEEQNEQDRKTLHRIAPINCAALYP